MSQFRPRKLSRFTPRFRNAKISISIRLRMVCAFQGDGDFRQALRPLMQSAVAAALTLFAAASPVVAQVVTNVPHDLTVRFQTPDVINPNNGALQSIWNAGGNVGQAFSYDLTKGWNTDTTFGSFKDLKTPSVNMGLFTIPAIDYGEWGAGGRAFSKGQNTGLRFIASATGGNVSVDYPVHVHIDTPKFIAPGATFTVHVTYQGDAAASVKTVSPQAYASVNLMLDAQVYLNGRVETGSKDLFNGDIIDWCNRDDPQSPKYGQSGANTGLKFNQEIFNTYTVLNKAASKYATFEYPGKGQPPSVTGELNLPSINTVGQPGSSSNYQSGAGGTSGSTSYEYTTGITIPSTVLQNPNATYARGQDKFITLTADFTNALTNGLEDGGIEVPPLNYTKNIGPLTLNMGLLDLKAELGVGFLQEFGFVPTPTVCLQIGDSGVTTQEYTIDPVKGVDIPVQMPALAPGADPNANVSIKLTPIVKMSNSFISNTYLNIKGGLSFRPVYLDGSSSFGSFNCEPVDLQVGADVPVPVYTTSFEIPFDAKTGDAFYVTTQAPPLAGLLSVNHSLLYYNENEISEGGNGVNAYQLTLTADPTILSPNTFAGIWFGTLNSGSSAATALTYDTQAFWDTVDSQYLMNIQDVNKDKTQATWDLLLANQFDTQHSQYPVNLNPGLHHIYASNTAKTSGSSFGPRVTTLPVAVAYPQPVLDTLGYCCLISDPGANQEFLSGNGLVYKAMPSYTYRSISGKGGPVVQTTACGPLVAGSDGFTLIAIDHTPFNDPAAPNAPFTIAPNGVGGFSRIKFDGKLLSPDPASVYNNFNRTTMTAYPFTSGMIPASMLARAGNHTVCVTNPTRGGKGGDSNTFILQIVSPVPAVDDACAVYQNPVQGSNTDLYSHDIVAGSPDTRVRITGSSLLNESQVYWQDTNHPLTTEFVNSHLMYATLPAAYITQPQSNHTLMVVNPRSAAAAQPDGGTSLSYKLNIDTAQPAITGAEVGGAPINALICATPQDVTMTIRGNHFWPGVTAWWNTQALAMTFVDEHTLTVTVPASLLTKADTINLAIKSADFNGHTATSASYQMGIVYARPTLLNLDAQDAPTSPFGVPPPAGTKSLTLTGGLFYSKSTVTVGGQRVQTTFVDATHLKAVVSPDIIKAAGSYDVVVNNPSTPASSGGTLGDGGASNALQYVTQGQTQQGQIGMTASLNRLNANTVQAQITLTNQGASSLSNMVAQFAALGGGLNPMTGLPYTVGTMKTGDVKTLTLQFPCPAALKGQTTALVLSGTMTGGLFNSSAAVTLP